MPGIAIVTDSTAALPDELVKKYGIYVVPQVVAFGHEVFHDGVDMTPAQFFRRLKTSSSLPTTSTPSVADFYEPYTALSRTADAIVSIHIARPLSATLESAYNAQRMLQDEAKIKGQQCIPIHIIDSRSVAMGLGFIVLAAARAVEQGKTLPEVLAAVETIMPRMNIVFTVETLTYLHKGGRIGGAATLVGSMLSLKPVLDLPGGRVEVLEKVRTYKRAVERVQEIMAERMGTAHPVHVAVLHGDVPELAGEVAERVKSRFDCAELYLTILPPVVGVHAGPGTLGLVFYAEEAG